MQKGRRFSVRSKMSATAFILSLTGAIPIQTVPRPRLVADSIRFSVHAPRSCSQNCGAVIRSLLPRTTIARGAFPTGPPYGDALDSAWMYSGSSTTMNSQACWFLAEGAFIAASRMRSILSFSTFPGM